METVSGLLTLKVAVSCNKIPKNSALMAVN